MISVRRVGSTNWVSGSRLGNDSTISVGEKISQGFSVPPALFFFFYGWGSKAVRVVKCGKSQSLRRVQQIIKKSASDALVAIDPLGSTEGWLQGVHCASLCDGTGIKVDIKVVRCTHLDQAGRLTG